MSPARLLAPTKLHTALVLAFFALSGCHLIFPFETGERAPADGSIADRSDGPTLGDVGVSDGILPDVTSQDAPLPDAPLPDSPLLDALPLDAPLPDSPLPDSPPPADGPLPDSPPPADAPLPDSPPPADAPLPDSPLPDAPLPDSPLPDAPLPDSAPPPDGPPPDSPPATGTVVVSEIMVAPLTFPSTGEWFELHNPANGAVNLKGWKLLDKETTSQKTPHVIQTDLYVNGGQYIVLGAFEATIPLDYVYRSTAYCGNQICFPDTEADFIEIQDPSNKTVDKVAYDFKGQSNWPIVSGASMSLKPGATDSSKWSSWCAETNVIQGDSAKNKGTPGAPPGCQ